MDQYLKAPQRATTRLLPKSALINVESPCFIELSVTHQGSNQARSVEVRDQARRPRSATVPVNNVGSDVP